ncbi:unnamed protein product [Cylicocyclus nassatus]|uniref:Bestrophin homolog n=1 Tax=Cylicocyclus nassatus TaxID=53992 RepID=A0AA36H4R2_CYLNA|nr:unnamed protein product [Cylicocyclus nassatus]
MTVSYNADVSSASGFTFVRLLLRWRGSIWKSIMLELVMWIIFYYIIFGVYRYALPTGAQRTFERIATYCDKNLVHIPLTFMLGFFVSMIVDRWRNTFNNMGWIENLALTVANLLRSNTAEARQMRRNIVRYCVLSQVLVFRDLSLKVRRRFPNLDSVVTAGFLHENELQSLTEIRIVYNKYWVPINWALNTCVKALEKGYFETPYAMIVVQTEIKTFRTALAMLCNFDWVPVPIAYPQVVFLAVRSYFIICLISRQFVLGEEPMFRSIIDLYVPFMTVLEFIFVVGWMKVAEALLNPLGEDDDDFECNFLIDKNIATGLMIVDNQYGFCPEPAPDCFSDPDYKPLYSEDSHLHGADHALVGSAENYDFTKGEEVKMVSKRPEDFPLSAESYETTPKFLRKLSSALSNRSRSSSMANRVDLEKEENNVRKQSQPNPALEAVAEENYSTISTIIIPSDSEDVTFDLRGDKRK